MKKAIRYTLLAGCALGAAALLPQPLLAGEAAPAMSCCSGMNLATMMSQTDTNAIPDRLPTCPVSGDKLGGDMGKPYTFVYKGQEVKLCCKSCKSDFDKNPAKYMAKIRKADKK
jgi:YHS domain-containing protein